VQSTTTQTDPALKKKEDIAAEENAPKARKFFLPRPRRPRKGFAAESAYLSTAILTGVLTGLSVTAFKRSINLVQGLTYGDLAKVVTPSLGILGAALLVPALGGLLVGILRELVGFTPGLKGSLNEVDNRKNCAFQKQLAKSGAGVATLGTGCSLGPEGPAVELGVSCSRLVSQFFSMSLDRRRQLLSAGAAAGVAAGFNAPVAGVFFALEIVTAAKDNVGVPRTSIAGTVLCAVVSALTARIGLAETLAFVPPPSYSLLNPLVELPLYVGLGAVSGAVSILFKRALESAELAFEGAVSRFKWMQRVPRILKPVIGGLLCGVVGFWFPQVLFSQYGTLDKVLTSASDPASSLILLLFLKMVMTAISAGSGLVGGTFAPSLFLGAVAGAAYQKVLAPATEQVVGLAAGLPLFQSVLGGEGVAPAGAYALVGAASVLSAVYRAPLTGTLLLFELTHNYDIVLPAGASAGLGSLLAELADRPRRYIDQIRTKPRPTPIPVPPPPAPQVPLPPLPAVPPTTLTAGHVAQPQAPAKTVEAPEPAAVSAVKGEKELPDRIIEELDELVDDTLPLSLPANDIRGVLDDIPVEAGLVPRVVALTPSTPLLDASQLMESELTDTAVVISPPSADITPTAGVYDWRAQGGSSEIVGVLTAGDIQRFVDRERAASGQQQESIAFDVLGKATASAAMTSELLSVREGDSLEKARETLSAEGLQLLPVLDQEGMFLGVVSKESIASAAQIERLKRRIGLPK